MQKFILMTMPVFAAVALSACDMIPGLHGTCNYTVSNYAPVANLANQSVTVLACQDGNTGIGSGPVTNTGYTQNVSGNPIAQSASDDGDHDECIDDYEDRYNPYSHVALQNSDLANYSLCQYNNSVVRDMLPKAYYESDYIVINKTDSCPNGFAAYDQSANPCQ